MQKSHHKFLIIGGGTAGIVVAARLRFAGEADVAIVEPSAKHFYQPLWTLVGAGEVNQEATAAEEASYIPNGVRWIKDRVSELVPDGQYVVTDSGDKLGYDFLVLAPGIQLNWDAIPGLREAIGKNASTNYAYDLAPKTWELIKGFKGGRALFHMPGTPIKCPGAPQKIAYLAADYFRRRNIRAEVIYGSGTGAIYGVKEYAAVLNKVIARYGIDARFNYELVEIRPASKEAVFQLKDRPENNRVIIPYDILHVVPPQSAPDFVRRSPLADPSQPDHGWVKVNKFTMQHPDYPNVFALGDVANTPNAKTGAAAMRQAPVVVHNLLALARGKEPAAEYNGYIACPIVTGYGRMLLCETDYSGKPAPTIPFIDTIKERYDMWLLKKYGLPWLYWHVMLPGRAVPFLHKKEIAALRARPEVGAA